MVCSDLGEPQVSPSLQDTSVSVTIGCSQRGCIKSIDVCWYSVSGQITSLQPKPTSGRRGGGGKEPCPPKWRNCGQLKNFLRFLPSYPSQTALLHPPMSKPTSPTRQSGRMEVQGNTPDVRLNPLVCRLHVNRPIVCRLDDVPRNFVDWNHAWN